VVAASIYLWSLSTPEHRDVIASQDLIDELTPVPDPPAPEIRVRPKRPKAKKSPPPPARRSVKAKKSKTRRAPPPAPPAAAKGTADDLFEAEF
jgi:hypothetical protein